MAEGFGSEGDGDSEGGGEEVIADDGGADF